MFAVLVRDHRRRLGLTQQELAERTGLSVRTIRNVEGGGATPHLRSARLLADAFGLRGAEERDFLAAVAAPPGPPPPRQLPAHPGPLAGREEELRRLDGILAAADGRPRTVVVVTGSAGIGKTALATCWAHRVSARFPDGQLHVDLRGFDPGAAPVEATYAARDMLEALGVGAAEIPAEQTARTALLRTVLATRRLLILLDDARDAAQVRPLLPGTGGSLVLLTSRSQLAGLVATEAAHPVTLGSLSRADAGRLLESRLGRERVAAEPEAVAEVVDLCAGLPLALSVVAARAALRPGAGLASIAAELRNAPERLDPFDTDEPAVGLRSAFGCSYRALRPAAARLFRLLGLHPGPDVGPEVAASAAALPLRAVRPLLAELTAAHLLTEQRPGRYAFHDLLRAYAAELNPPPDREAVVRRVTEHHLGWANRAARLISPHTTPVPPLPPSAGVLAPGLTDLDDAHAWLSDVRPAVPAVLAEAAEHGLDDHVWRLAAQLTSFLDRDGRWDDLLVIAGAGMAACERLGDELGRARCRRALGRANAGLRRWDVAEEHLRAVMDYFRLAGEPVEQGWAGLSLASLHGRQRRNDLAIRESAAALEVFRGIGHRIGQAAVHNALGWFQTESGEHRAALANCRVALRIFEETEDIHGQAITWDSLGLIHRHLDELGPAADCYGRAVALHRVHASRHFEADSLVSLGDIQHAAGDPDAAARSWRAGLEIFEEIGHPDADAVRGRLAGHLLTG